MAPPIHTSSSVLMPRAPVPELRGAQMDLAAVFQLLERLHEDPISGTHVMHITCRHRQDKIMKSSSRHTRITYIALSTIASAVSM